VQATGSGKGAKRKIRACCFHNQQAQNFAKFLVKDANSFLTQWLDPLSLTVRKVQ